MKIYRASHKTFDEYCRERWGIKRAYACQQIGAARIAEHLANVCHGKHSPSALTERLIRPLTRLSAPSEDDKREPARARRRRPR